MASSTQPGQLAIETARRMSANQLLVSLDGGPILSAFVMEDFAYNLGNVFESLWEDAMGTASASIQMLEQMAASVGMQWGSGQTRLKSIEQTIAQWQGSEKVSFNLPLVFIATDPTMDVLHPVMALNKLVLPSQGQLGGVINSPSYSGLGMAGTKTTLRGGVGFAYGQWFRTPNWFLVRKFSPIISKATIIGADGLQRPLMAAAQLSIEAYRMIFADEFNGFFISEIPVETLQPNISLQSPASSNGTKLNGFSTW